MNAFGSFVYEKRKWVVVSWVFFIIFFGYFASKVPSVLSGNGFEFDGSYNKTQNILKEDFNQDQSSILILFEKEENVKNVEFASFIDKTFDQLEKESNASNYISPFENEENMVNGNIAYGVLSYQEPPENMGEELDKISSTLDNKDGINVSMTGGPVIEEDLNVASQQDLARAEMIALPIALVILLIAFGSLVSASIPLVIGIISIISTMGIMYFFSYQMNLTIFILNIVPMIGLALSIDFALLFIDRFKEEVQKHSIKEAIITTISTAGRSIIFSGLCVFIGLLGLMFIEIDIFRNVALGGMTVVFVSVLSAITFLPALLSILGKNINRFSILKVSNERSSLWRKFASFVMKRPVIMASVTLILLVGALIPVKDMQLSVPGTDALPTSFESRVSYDTYVEHFVEEEKRDEVKAVVIIESEENILNEDSLVSAKSIIDDIERSESVFSLESPFSLSGIEDGLMFYQSLQQPETMATFAPILENYTTSNMMLVHVYFESENAAQAWVKDWEEKETSMTIHLGGTPKFEQEIFDEIVEKAPYGFAFIVLTTFFILLFAFKSILIPIKAILMNILSLSATFGIVVWIFQGGHLGIEPVSLALILPIFVFSIVFSLSMDYEVFLISRIHENYLKSGDNDSATLEGLTTTSKIITSAAAIMIVVTGAFAFTGVMPVKQLGVGIALAIFIDATIVRMILVPAFMKLLGDWNWWFFGKKKAEKANRD
ncbi:MMPL family transporter [Sutcliffiella deserti]|uniref:MMPL family transporter n=1 Tax=Sutcliffiella deserti TaxID=2875501 RepID=UPI001CBF8637|nr:MMPL family transporter [Sutcliffiella deserti]